MDNLKLIFIFLFFSISFQLSIVTEVLPKESFVKTYSNYSILKNLFSYKICLFNSGSKNLNSRLEILGKFKVFSEIKNINPSQEFCFENFYFLNENETLKIKLIVNDKEYEIEEIEANFSDFLNYSEVKIDYMYENEKIEIIGAENFYFQILDDAYYEQKKLEKIDEIKVFTNNKKIKIVFFNFSNYFIKEVEISEASIFKKILFKIKKFIISIFSI
jgi:sulfur carrier protein ThiS